MQLLVTFNLLLKFQLANISYLALEGERKM